MKRRQEKHQRSKINKEKLLDIAKKNAHKILKAGGDFMGMDQDRLIPIPQPQFQNPNPLWDFGSYPERKGDVLLFEKEVLDIQVGKG